jgi:hypothetical protein
MDIERLFIMKGYIPFSIADNKIILQYNKG